MDYDVIGILIVNIIHHSIIHYWFIIMDYIIGYSGLYNWYNNL